MNKPTQATPGALSTAALARLFTAGFLLLLVIKVLLARALELYSDEIFYWQASTHPAPAYSDLPFMTALLAGAGSQTLGDNPTGVRSAFLIMGSALPFLVLWIAGPLTGRRQALEAAALTLCLPLGAFAGLLAVPDVPLLFFSLLFLGFFERATRFGDMRFWLLAGLAAALGISTHYRFVLFPAAAFLFLVLRPDQRWHLKKAGLWLATGLMLIALCPILLFNLNNELSALDYHLIDRHPWRFQAEGLLHPLKQAVLVTPLLYAALAVTLFLLLAQLNQGDSRRAMFGLFSLLSLGVYFVLAPWTDTTRTTLHWPLSGYLPLLVFLPETLRGLYRTLATKWHARRARSAAILVPSLGFAGSLVALAGIGSQAFQAQLVPILGNDLLSNKMAGWDEMTERVEVLLAKPQFPQGTLVVTNNYYSGAQIEFAGNGERRVFNIDDDKAIRDGRYHQYHLWNQNEQALSRHTGATVLYVVEDSTLTVLDKIKEIGRACELFSGLTYLHQLSLFEGDKAFSFYSGTVDSRGTEDCPMPALAWLDTPAPGAAIEGPVTISGWAVSGGGGVKTVNILVDGKAHGSAVYGLTRTDVASIHADLKDPNAPGLGFDYSFPVVDNGELEIAVEVISETGERQIFGEREVFIEAGR